MGKFIFCLPNIIVQNDIIPYAYIKVHILVKKIFIKNLFKKYSFLSHIDIFDTV